MPDPLTPRQQSIYDWMLFYYQQHGIPPTIREVGQNFQILSPNGTYCHLKTLHRKGWIEVYDRTARGIRFLVGGKDASQVNEKLLTACRHALIWISGSLDDTQDETLVEKVLREVITEAEAIQAASRHAPTPTMTQPAAAGPTHSLPPAMPRSDQA